MAACVLLVESAVLDPGPLASGFVTGLREGMEAAVVIAVVCASLARTGNSGHLPKVWLGTAAAVAGSALAGIAIWLTAGGLPEPLERLFEGTVMLAAAGVVSWMLFWMRRHAPRAGGALREAVDRVLAEGTAWGLALLAFSVVIREGLETALFLAAQATAAAGGGVPAAGAPLSVLVGSIGGLLAAVAFGWAFYRGSRRLDVARFFRWTGVLLVLIAAGLVSHAAHELVEAGVISVGSQPAFDIGAFLADDAGIGLFLRALFGYSSRPETIALAAWLGYVGLVLPLYLRPLSVAAPAPPAGTATAAGT